MYRYGFNGKEKDDKGEFGDIQYDYGFRIYNPAIGKFLSVDPLTKSYPWYTPYQFAGNKPIWAFDLDGLEEFVFQLKEDKNGDLVLTLKDVEQIIEKSWDWSTFSIRQDMNPQQQYTVEYEWDTYLVVGAVGVQYKAKISKRLASLDELNDFDIDDFDWGGYEFEMGFRQGLASSGLARPAGGKPSLKPLKTPAGKTIRGSSQRGRLNSNAQKKGFKVPVKLNGYPDLKGYLYKGKGKSTVLIKYTGSRKGDFDAANKQGGFTDGTPDGYTWHHTEFVAKKDGSVYGVMQLVKTEAHRATGHSGGVQLYEGMTGTKYRD